MSPLLALAFGAGLLAPVNPCGFALLPAYFSSLLGDTGTAPAGQRLRRALGAGTAVTLGFSATLTLIGVALALGLQALVQVVPWLAVMIGVILLGVGILIVLGRGPALGVPGAGQAASWTSRRAHLKMLGFGAGYAIASASCTVGILLAVVAQAVATGTIAGAAAVFAAYATGSAVLLLALAVTAAVANTALAASIGRAARYLPRIAGALLAASGAYLIAYWTPVLLDRSQAPNNPLTRTAASVTTWISTHQTMVVTAATIVVATGLLAVVISSRRDRRSAAATRSAEPVADCCQPAQPSAHESH